MKISIIYVYCKLFNQDMNLRYKSRKPCTINMSDRL